MIARAMPRLGRSGAAIAALGLLGVACKGSDATAEEEATPVVSAKTAVAAVEPFTRTLTAIGTVVGRPGRYAAGTMPFGSMMYFFAAPLSNSW